MVESRFGAAFKISALSKPISGVKPEYEFGFGLSYTTFAYSNLVIEDKDVSFTLKNTGDCAGAEVAQVYVGAPDTGWLSHPKKELRGFEKIYLEPGEERRITIRLEDRDFRYWNPMLHDWVTEPGEYRILVGASSRHILLSGTVEIQNSHKITFEPSME